MKNANQRNAKVFTFGYQGHQPAELAALPQDVVICDVRYSPASRNPDWSRKRLSALLKDRYRWLPAFGNINYKNGGPVRLAAPDEGVATVKELIAQGRTVVLMCVCKDLQHCHRRHAAEIIARECGVTAKELTNEERARLTGAQGELL